MIVFPKEEPVIENLNSFYLDGAKLLEHYQGQLDSGAIHFKSAVAQGAVFFDKDGLLEGVYESRQEKILGKEAVEHLIRSTAGDNYTIGVFKVAADEVYFWAGILGATRVYEDLGAEFTDLDGLIRKMASEKLSGYIEISPGRAEETGLIFFRNGLILGGAYSGKNSRLDRSRESRDAIIQKAKEKGGVFHVSKISAGKPEAGDKAPHIQGQDILRSLEELLVVLETLMHRKKSTQGNFGTLLRRKLIDLAETYPFLDPFAGEFAYSNNRIHFGADASEGKIVEGLLAALNSMAEENGVQAEFRSSMDGWFQKHGKTLIKLGVKP